MFKKILVANRGEIAMRIIRACRELNIATVAIYAECDATAIFVKKANEAYLVGPGPVQGFLDAKQIVNLAKRVGADAIHPGYGFLAENAEFAQLCQEASTRPPQRRTGVDGKHQRVVEPTRRTERRLVWRVPGL